MKIKIRKALITTFMIFNVSLSNAGIINDIPSCYAANKIKNDQPSENEIFILIDQTTKFDSNLQKSIKENTSGLIDVGTSYVIGEFSSYAQGHYLNVISAGTFEHKIADNLRNDISVRLLKTFDACMDGQKKYGLKVAASALNKALSAGSSNLAKSDVIASLKDLSDRVKKSKAKNKVVFIASDMLENSSLTSFYFKQAVRQIKPDAELKIASSNQMIGDFGGAKIFIIGAGLINEDASSSKGVYRSPQTMQALNTFWLNWFKQSNADLVEFGQPALLNPVTF